MNIKTEYKNRKITVFHTKSTASTNADAKALKKDGALFVADTQSDGRGRLGRSFVSNEGGVYMSLYLSAENFNRNSADILFCTTASAAAAAEATDFLTGKSSFIKWVNDIYLENKKVCGILCESAFEGERLKGTVIGVGANLLKHKDFEGELSKKAGFIFGSGDFEVLRRSFIEHFLERFFFYLDSGKTDELLRLYREKNYLIDKEVDFVEGGAEKSGRVIGINDDFSLSVLSDGETKALRFGEVNLNLRQ